MIKQKKAQWPWHVLTVLVLIGLAGALYYATSLMSYEWRWNRVPQYFVYQAEEAQRAAETSTVIELVRKGDQAEVVLRADDGTEQRLTVADNRRDPALGRWPVVAGVVDHRVVIVGVRGAGPDDWPDHRPVQAVE